MNINQAYNKGLDDAENLAIAKLRNALSGIDDTPFNNSQMEEIRQNILSKKPEELGDTQTKRNIDDYTVKILLGQPIDDMCLNSIDVKAIEIIKYIKSLDKPKLVNKISVKIKSLLRDLEVDFIKNNTKLD